MLDRVITNLSVCLATVIQCQFACIERTSLLC